MLEHKKTSKMSQFLIIIISTFILVSELPMINSIINSNKSSTRRLGEIHKHQYGVDLVIRHKVKGPLQTFFDVDSSIESIRFQISGTIQKAIVIFPNDINNIDLFKYQSIEEIKNNNTFLPEIIKNYQINQKTNNNNKEVNNEKELLKKNENDFFFKQQKNLDEYQNKKIYLNRNNIKTREEQIQKQQYNHYQGQSQMNIQKYNNNDKNNDTDDNNVKIIDKKFINNYRSNNNDDRIKSNNFNTDSKFDSNNNINDENNLFIDSTVDNNEYINFTHSNINNQYRNEKIKFPNIIFEDNVLYRIDSVVTKHNDVSNVEKYEVDVQLNISSSDIGTWILETCGIEYDIHISAISKIQLGNFINYNKSEFNSNNKSSESKISLSLPENYKINQISLVNDLGEKIEDLTQDITQNDQTQYRNNKNDRLLTIDNDSKLTIGNDRILTVDNNRDKEIDNDRNEIFLSDLNIPFQGFMNHPMYLQFSGTDNNGDPFQRISQIPFNQQNSIIPSPISLDVNPTSTLTALPGQTVQILFDLTNNFNRPIKFLFTCRDQFQYVRNIHPQIRWVDPFETIQISVWLEAQGAEGSTDVVSFTAIGFESITRNVYLHIGRENYDSTKPDISYSFKGDCDNALTPETCVRASWGLEAIIQDTGSGLLKVISKPFPLRYRNDFIAGTRDAIKVQYISSCCFSKVDLIAFDVKGNVNKYTIDVENRWLSLSQILAILFGVLILIVILILIVYAIAKCIQTRRQRNFLGE